MSLKGGGFIKIQNFVFGGNFLKVTPTTLEPIFQNWRQTSGF